jgi:hypothetical protein
LQSDVIADVIVVRNRAYSRVSLCRCCRELNNSNAHGVIVEDLIVRDNHVVPAYVQYARAAWGKRKNVSQVGHQIRAIIADHNV